MTYQEIISLLAFAGDHEQSVRIVTTDGSELFGVPTSLDTHVTAHEVYLLTGDDDGTEIALSLAGITSVELLARGGYS